MSREAHVFNLLSAYALDCLDAVEKAQVEAHLRECDLCRADLQTYREIVQVLPLVGRESEPPPGLKSKIMQRAAQARNAPATQNQPIWWEHLAAYFRKGAPAWGLVGLVLILMLGANNLLLWQRMNQLESKAQLPFSTIVLTGTETSPDASGVLVLSQDGEHGTLIVDGLAVLDSASQYQLWLIQDGQRTNGGVFSVGKDGYGSHWVSSPQPLASYSSFGVTIEPTGGSPGPTGAKVLGSES
ncbi:MAG TPA: anti-sigma factor [Anaerolineales bacterium]|nr:anti-sigma factor [Anaerolineales bacterium]